MSTSLSVLHTQEGGDLSTCDREPIHIPGSIQPHGVLLSLDESTLQVLQASANAGELCGRGVESILGSPLTDLFALGEESDLIRNLANPSLEKNPLYVGSVNVAQAAPGAWHVIAHRNSGALILEFERAETKDALSFQNLYPLVRTFMARLGEASTSHELSDMTVQEVRRLTGFDRVLVYRFNPDWHGQVIAESCDPALSSYLDLWFPASDIPAQARELYRLNRLRLIANADYKPILLIPPLDPNSGKPLDLSYAALRSVSPVHIEYLKNMGVTASMSISLIQHGKLWGLISLHHRTAREVPFEVRVACDFLGQALSTQLLRSENQAEYEHRLYLKSITAQLLSFMAQEEHFIDGLTQHPDELLSFGSAQGAAVLFDGKCVLLGKTPSERETCRVIEWVSKQGEGDVFHTESLSASMPDSDGFRKSGSGILAISISKLYQSYVIWFRPEVVQTVKWGGDPRKPVETTSSDNAMRIHPRKSFETWKETVRGRSLPWRQSEIESAAELRNAIVGIVLRKAEELAALSDELKRSNKELEAFSYSVSHDLRAPFRHITGYAQLLQEHLQSVLDATGARYIETISKSAELAGVLVDNLLNFSRVGRAKLNLKPVDMSQLLDEAKQTLQIDEEDPPIRWDISPLPAVSGDPVLLRLVWQNLLSNALKFTRAQKRPQVTIRADTEEREVVFSVSDNGVGFNQLYAHKLFGVFQRLHSHEEFEGNGIGLANVRRVIGKHGGRTWAEGELGKGATFYFTLPIKGSTEEGIDA